MHSHFVALKSELENPWGQLVRLKISLGKSKSDHGSASFADRAIYASKLTILAFPVDDLSLGISKNQLIREVYKAKFAYSFDPVDWFVCLPSEGKPNYWLAYYVPILELK